MEVLLGRSDDEGLTYRIQNSAESPWEDFGEFGKVMDREDVLRDSEKALFFQMVDKIAAMNSRLIQHVKRFIIP